MSITRILVAALAVAALAAPAAQAVPADYPDGHPQAQAQAGQDLRSPDAREPVDAITRPVGQPTWPMSPQPIVSVADDAPAPGGGPDWLAIGTGVAGGLLAAACIALIVTRPRIKRRLAAP
jgi:hypothetical protein